MARKSKKIEAIEKELKKIDPSLAIVPSGGGYAVGRFIESAFLPISPSLSSTELYNWARGFLSGWVEAWRTARGLVENNKSTEFKRRLKNDGFLK